VAQSFLAVRHKKSGRFKAGKNHADTKTHVAQPLLAVRHSKVTRLKAGKNDGGTRRPCRAAFLGIFPAPACFSLHNHWPPLPNISGLLESVTHLQHTPIVVVPADNLNSDRQTAL
jgi:hypothetical protein